jgi:ATP-dependent helicase HrpB
VAAAIREVSGRTGNLTLLTLATAVKREWIQETFPAQVSTNIEHLFDRAHRRVSAVKIVRFHDLVIHHEHQRETDPEASGCCLAEAYGKTLFELPLFNHELKQMVARANLIRAALPELDFPALDAAAVKHCLARAFAGLTLAKEAQAAPLRGAFQDFLGSARLEWLDELAPTSIGGLDEKKLKLLYAEEPSDDDGHPNPPEVNVKLHSLFQVKEHPRICEGRLPVKLWLCTPDGKRLESTTNWPAFKATTYPKLKAALQKRFPTILWV